MRARLDHREDPSAWARELGISREAVELYLASEVIDLHVDSFIWQRLFGYDLSKRHDRGLLGGLCYSQADIPRVLEAAISGATWVIIGHSERRQYFGETDAQVGEKVAAATAAGLKPIACIGETLAEREAGKTLEVVFRQLATIVPELNKKPGFGVIAYEPVWAIGTGKVASNEQAQEVHAAIREHLKKTSAELAEVTRILYGGSVKADNAAGLLACADIDGALVGGAALDAEGFAKIAKAAPIKN